MINTSRKGPLVKSVKNDLGMKMATSLVIIKFTTSYPLTLRTTLTQVQCRVTFAPRSKEARIPLRMGSALGALLAPLLPSSPPIRKFLNSVAMKVTRGWSKVKGRFTSEQAVTTELMLARGADTRKDMAVFPDVFLWCKDTVAGTILYE